MQIQVGSKIPLALQLFDGATDKYVKAWLYDENGDELAASPVALSHVAGGLYMNSTVTMPADNHVVARMKVYDDSGFTVASSDHSDTSETYASVATDFKEAALTGVIDSDDDLVGYIEQE